jgi:hypothetical protein
MSTLAMGEEVALLIPIIAVGGGLLVGMVGIIAGTIRSVSVSRHREESRREIAAYIAEGSMSPDDGAKLMAAGPARTKGCC